MPPRKSSVRLSPRYRRYALARLEAVIAAAERDRAGHLAAAERLAAAGRNAAWARARLRLADYRLGLLRRTRAWLAAGELPRAGDP